MLDVRVRSRLELIRDDAAPGNGLERQRAHEACRRCRHDRDYLVAVLLQAAGNLNRLVGPDAAGDSQRDQHQVIPSSGHLTPGSRPAIFSTAPVTTSCWATVVFLCSPTATRG